MVMQMENKVDIKKPSKEEIDLIQQFEAHYNAIDHHLRKVTGRDKTIPFSVVVGDCGKYRKWWSDTEEFLKIVGNLRNCIIHEKTAPYQYLAIPTPLVVERLKSILDQLIHPVLVIQKFKKKVEVVKVTDSIADVLKRIYEYDYSQFPVYDDRSFKGLLTENGITRWLAHHVASRLSLVELAETTVKETLREEEKRKNWEFIGKNKAVDELKELFSNNDLLEAVLITETGKQSESLLGIVTRWDMLNLQSISQKF